jgi:hypothetical protein
VAEDLIVTNRHVLQAIATPQGQGKWRFNGDITIDFGHEFRATESLNRRGLSGWCLPVARRSPFRIDHARLDLVLIELEPSRPRAEAAALPCGGRCAGLGLEPADRLHRRYPGRPRVQDETPTLLEKLFKQTFGCKRLARVRHGNARSASRESPGTGPRATTPPPWVTPSLPY